MHAMAVCGVRRRVSSKIDMVDNCDESPIAPKARRTREERNLGHFILTVTLLGLVLPIYISPGIDVCFSNLRWLSSLKRVQDLIRLNIVTATEACSLDWLILVYYFIWISGMIFLMYLARHALRRRVAATSVAPRKLLTWGLLFALLFVGLNGIMAIITLTKRRLNVDIALLGASNNVRRPFRSDLS